MGPAQPEQTTRRRRRRTSGPARYLLAVLIALVLQVSFVGLLALMAHVQASLPPEPKPPKPPSAVALRPLTAQEWAQNRATPLTGPQNPTPTPPRKAEEKKPEKKPDGQVVDVAPGNQQKAPDAKYLAERDNKVDKETRAREQTPFYKNAKPQTTAPRSRQGAGVSEEQAERLAGNNGRAADDRPLSEGGKKSAFELPDARRKQEIALKQDPTSPGPGIQVNNRDESDEVVGNGKRLRVQQGAGDGDEGSEGRLGSPGLARLMPSQAVMDQIIGGAPNDHLKNVNEGDGTYLNTREWKFASFFNRVKQSVGTQWNPNTALMRRDPTGDIYAGRDRYTMVQVTLDEYGKVADIRVEKSSGLDFLDLEAVESFKRAQPFPNPPAGLLEDDAKVRFSFGFFMDMGGGPRMRLFRQPN
ncbi:energy transducer TonB family protein [Archangium primigenium]|uniref:energy transducer TonB family protein n=1 Tax=[Archangium] primigenium TaxID=2792470 RepID=UPI00195971DC|nr:energy transducer TonB [Archangium primigenium]MBM7115395.1 energy transducer TonB [Archangium primigenium]